MSALSDRQRAAPAGAGEALRVAIMTGDPGWHGRQLARALAALGVAVEFVALADCKVDLEANRFGIVVPGFGDRLPDAVLVREVAAGSFEQVTFRLAILHALAEWGVLVYNSARAIERTVDKSMTSMLLARAGIATPPTWVTEHEAEARATIMRETARGHRVVIKPLFGSQGRDLVRIGRGDSLPAIDAYHGLYYLQRFVESAAADACDYRAFVVGNEVVGMMARRGVDWIHNVAQGAHCIAHPLERDLADLACAAVRSVGLAYAGVDLMRSADGTPLVIEVNSIPAWRGLQSVTNRSIGAALAHDFVRQVEAGRAEAAR